MPGKPISSLSPRCHGFAIALVALSLGACSSTHEVVTQRIIAPENLEVAKLRSVVMVEFTGDVGTRLSRDLASRLAQLRIDGKRFFAVTGPITLHSGIDGEVDGEGGGEMVSIARKLSARAVIRGRAKLGRDVTYELPDLQKDCLLRSKNGKSCIKKYHYYSHCADIVVKLKYSVLATEVATNRRIYDPGRRKLIERGRGCVRYPAGRVLTGVAILNEELDKVTNELGAALVAEAAELIHRDIAPYRKSVSVSFLSEPDALPDAPADRFGLAADWVENRRFEAGCAIWRKMVEAGQRDPALTFNLGACAEQEENYRAARQFYALTQRYVDQLRARGSNEDRNYSNNDWAEHLAEAQNRLGLLQRSQQAMKILRAGSLP